MKTIVLKVILTDCIYSHLNGIECVLTNFEIINNQLVASTNILHPEDNNTYLWINVYTDTNYLTKF